MATRRNPYADPALAQSFNNIAAMFAPPSGAELAGYATANAKRQEAQRLADLFAYSQRPDYNRETFERQALGAGLYNPSNSFYSVDQNNATTRRGQDLTATTSRENNIRDNSRAMAQTRFGALSEGQVLPAMPGEVASMYGLPAEPQTQTGMVKLSQNQTAVMPDGRRMEGINRPLSSDEVMAQQLQRQRDAGLIDDQTMRDLIVGRQGGTPVAIVGPDGKPRLATPGEAVRLGAQPAPQAGGARKDGTALIGGRQVPVTRDPSGLQWQLQDGTPVPPDVQVMEMAKPQGTNEQLGITQSNVTAANKLQASIDAAEYTVRNMREILAQNPNVAGVPGRVKGLLQSLASSANQTFKAFAAENPNAPMQLGEAKDLLNRMAGAYDPNIVRLQAGIMDLAYARAQINNPTGEVSRQAFERALESFGQSLLSSQQDLETGLAAFEKDSLGAARVQVQRLRGGPGATPMQPQQPGTTPQTGSVERFIRGPDGKLVRAQ